MPEGGCTGGLRGGRRRQRCRLPGQITHHFATRDRVQRSAPGCVRPSVPAVPDGQFEQRTQRARAPPSAVTGRIRPRSSLLPTPNLRIRPWPSSRVTPSSRSRGAPPQGACVDRPIHWRPRRPGSLAGKVWRFECQHLAIGSQCCPISATGVPARAVMTSSVGSIADDAAVCRQRQRLGINRVAVERLCPDRPAAVAACGQPPRTCAASSGRLVLVLHQKRSRCGKQVPGL